MKRYLATLVVLGCTWIAQPESVWGDFSLQFSANDGGTFGNSFDMKTGDILELQVYLSDINGDAGILNTEGLFSFALNGQVTSGASGAIINAAPDQAFDFVGRKSFDETSIQWDVAVFSGTVPMDTSILLGSLQFSATSDGTTTFAWNDLVPGGGTKNANWLSGTGGILDEQIFGLGATNGFQLSISSITAVPEPSSIILVAIALPGVLAARCRKSRERQRRKKTTQ